VDSEAAPNTPAADPAPASSTPLEPPVHTAPPQAAVPAAPASPMPFNIGFLLLILVFAVGNAGLFGWVAARNFQSPMDDSPGVLVVWVMLGIAFTAGCLLASMTVARWINRTQLMERILLFVLLSVAGLTVFGYVLNLIPKQH